MTSASKFFDGVLFPLSSLVTGPGFMQYHYWFWSYDKISLIRDWPEIRKSEIPTSRFCTIYGDWGELGISNLTWPSLIKCYWMLQNAKVIAFTVSGLLRENQQGGKIIPPPTQIRVNRINRTYNLNVLIWKRRPKVKCPSY